MDSPYASGAVGAMATAILALLVRLNHKRLRSTCCGRKIDLSVDFEDTTPTKKEVAIVIAPPPPITLPSGTETAGESK